MGRHTLTERIEMHIPKFIIGIVIVILILWFLPGILSVIGGIVVAVTLGLWVLVNQFSSRVDHLI